MANAGRLRQLSIGGLVEDNPLTSGATTLTSAALASVTGGVTSTQHLAIVLDPDGVDGTPEVIYVTALTNGAGSATITRAQEGTTARQHVNGTPWIHGPTLRDAVTNKSTTYLSAITPSTSTGSWSAMLSTTLDLAIVAAVDDVIEIGLSFVFNQFSYYRVDAATIVAAAVVNYCSGGGSTGKGVSAWRTNQADSAGCHGGAILYVVVSGDLSAGTVTFRPIVQRDSGSTSTAPTIGGTNEPTHFYVKNLGPAAG